MPPKSSIEVCLFQISWSESSEATTWKWRCSASFCVVKSVEKKEGLDWNTVDWTKTVWRSQKIQYDHYHSTIQAWFINTNVWNATVLKSNTNLLWIGTREKIKTMSFCYINDPNGCWTKNRGLKTPQIIHFNLIGFSIIFTIHFVSFPPIFGLTPKWTSSSLPLDATFWGATPSATATLHILVNKGTDGTRLQHVMSPWGWHHRNQQTVWKSMIWVFPKIGVGPLNHEFK